MPSSVFKGLTRIQIVRRDLNPHVESIEDVFKAAGITATVVRGQDGVAITIDGKDYYGAYYDYVRTNLKPGADFLLVIDPNRDHLFAMAA
jgi:hypothetical protein